PPHTNISATPFPASTRKSRSSAKTTTSWTWCTIICKTPRAGVFLLIKTGLPYYRFQIENRAGPLLSPIADREQANVVSYRRFRIENKRRAALIFVFESTIRAHPSLITDFESIIRQTFLLSSITER